MVRDTSNIKFNGNSIRCDGIFSVLIMINNTDKKQNFIIGCLYSEQPVFTVMMRVNSSSLGHAVIQLSSHWHGDQMVTHENDLANFGQSLDNAPFGICLKSPDHDFQKLLVIC